MVPAVNFNDGSRMDRMQLLVRYSKGKYSFKVLLCESDAQRLFHTELLS